MDAITEEVRASKWNEIRIVISLIENDRFQFYYATEKMSLYKADPEGHLRKFYALVGRALPSAIERGKYEEARQILHMAFFTGDLYTAWIKPKIEDREKYLREMDQVLAGLKSEIEKPPPTQGKSLSA